MFSDCKTRCFNLEDSQIERTDRLDRLVLMLSLALYWAVSTGMWNAMQNKMASMSANGACLQRRRLGQRDLVA